MITNPEQSDQPAPSAGQTRIHILTPLATGAIAAAQLTGPEALSIAEQIFRPRRSVTLSQVAPSQVVYGQFLDGTGAVFDDGLAVRGDHQGTPWVEFNLHGGIRIVQRLVQRAQELGAVLSHAQVAGNACGQTVSAGGPGQDADPSFAWLRPLERWMQAYLALAATQRVVRWLADQPQLWRGQIAKWQGLLERDELGSVLNEVQERIAAASAAQAWRGRTLAIIGPPNAGKSTLANRLAGRDISLVADLPGTTRDWVDHPIAVQGWPVTIIDTAGLRKSEDAVEGQGVLRAMERASAADVRLLVLDAGDPDGSAGGALLDQISLKVYDVVVYNKCDLPCRRPGSGRDTGVGSNPRVEVSSLTGQGWPDLEREISMACGFGVLQERKPLVFCAELQDRLGELVSALRSQQTAEAQAILESL